MLDSDNVEKLFTFAEMEAAKKKTNNSFYEFPGRIPPDAVRAAVHWEGKRARSRAVSSHGFEPSVSISALGAANNTTPAALHSHLVAPQGGEYSLFYANCESHVVVSVEVTAELYNEAWSGARDYLSAGEAPLPVVFLVMSILYFFAAACWAGVLFTHRSTTHKIHFLMLALVAFKALATMCEAGMYHMKRTTGSPDGWNIAYYIFSLFRGVLLFTVIVLLGTGWSFLKPFLSDREKRIIMLVLPVQVMANVADIILLENGPAVKGWFTWRDVFHLLDIICCCAILFPIVWSIRHLRQAAEADGKAQRNLLKLQLFRQFYVMVVAYIYFTRIVVYVIAASIPFYLLWLGNLATELATLIFFVSTGIKFSPSVDNPYLPVSTGGGIEGEDDPEYGLGGDGSDEGVGDDEGSASRTRSPVRPEKETHGLELVAPSRSSSSSSAVATSSVAVKTLS